jgi:serine/threonine-protein kinase
MWIAFAVLGVSVATQIALRLFESGASLAGLRHPLNIGASLTLTLGALALGVLARLRPICNFKILNIALSFEVIASLCVAILESQEPRLPDEPTRGVSAAAVLILIFTMAIPASTVKRSVAAFLSAAMVPLGMWLQAAYGTGTLPGRSDLILAICFTLFSATAAVILGGVMFQLNKDVSRLRQMGSYHLIELIGKGGMGEVWRGEHRLLSRSAAVKLIKPEVLESDPETVQTALRRFEREARETAALRSPHTIAIYDFGLSEDRTFYMVMEYLDGLDLETLVERYGPLPASRAIYLLVQICDSLAEAHSRGLIHRDIKPRNIFVSQLGSTPDFVKVLDFGLVKYQRGARAEQLTTQFSTAGTPAYMAPEMVTGAADEVTPLVDIYMLGCVAYWLVTGQLVFAEAETALAMAVNHVSSEPIPPSVRTDNPIPADLEAIILRCLAKQPLDRPQGAEELRAMLLSCADATRWDRDLAARWWRYHKPPIAVAGAHRSDSHT